MNKFLAATALAVVFLAAPAQASDSFSTDFINGKGEKIGNAVLRGMEGGTLITVDLQLPPGVHALHIHETATCDAPDFKGAGGHLNPGHDKHGFDSPQGFHDGDLPNLYVEPNGHIKAEIFTDRVHLTGEDGLENGTALIIHEKADDYSTDPSGNAGNRIACAPIKH